MRVGQVSPRVLSHLQVESRLSMSLFPRRNVACYRKRRPHNHFVYLQVSVGIGVNKSVCDIPTSFAHETNLFYEKIPQRRPQERAHSTNDTRREIRMVHENRPRKGFWVPCRSIRKCPANEWPMVHHKESNFTQERTKRDIPDNSAGGPPKAIYGDSDVLVGVIGDLDQDRMEDGNVSRHQST